MSDLDNEDSQCRNRSDLESTLPYYSLVDSTIDLTPLNRDEDSLNENINNRRRFNTTCLPNENINTRRRFNTTCFSADQLPRIRANSTGDSNISGPAPNTGNSVCYAPPKGAGLNKGEELLESPTQTTPQINPPSPFPFHCGRTIGRGRRMEVEGAKNSTQQYMLSCVTSSFII